MTFLSARTLLGLSVRLGGKLGGWGEVEGEGGRERERRENGWVGTDYLNHSLSIL
jgi:hypothetical protein